MKHLLELAIIFGAFAFGVWIALPETDHEHKYKLPPSTMCKCTTKEVWA